MEIIINSLFIPPTGNTPKVVIRGENIYKEGIVIEISGESVPDDPMNFYAPVFQWIKTLDIYLGAEKYASGTGMNININFIMEYFNSSSAKIFITIIENFTGLKNKYPEMNIVVNWQYNDEDIREAGEEFMSLVSLPFNIMQNQLIIKGSVNSPDIIINTEQKLFEISGKSFMEKGMDFYTPVLDWMQLYGNQYFNNDFQINFKLRYFNTPSAKMLFEIIKKLDGFYSSGKNISINWYYCDEDDKEEAEDLASLVKIPINYIKYN